MHTRHTTILGTAIAAVAALVGMLVMVTEAEAHTPGKACQQEGARQSNPHCQDGHENGSSAQKNNGKAKNDGNGNGGSNGNGNKGNGNKGGGNNGGGTQNQGHLRCHEGLDGETIAEQVYHGTDDSDGLEGTELDGTLVHHPLGNGDLSGPIYVGARDEAPDEMKPVAYELACAASLAGA